MASQITAVRLPLEERAELERFAQRSDQTLTEVIRAALRRYVELDARNDLAGNRFAAT